MKDLRMMVFILIWVCLYHGLMSCIWKRSDPKKQDIQSDYNGNSGLVERFFIMTSHARNRLVHLRIH